MSSGGGGQSGVTRYDWNDVIGSYWGGRPGPNGLGGGGVLGKAAEIANQDWKPYGTADYNKFQDPARARVAGFNGDMTAAGDILKGGVYGSKGYGDDTTVAGQGYIQEVLAGKKGNKYSGENPYFKETVANANADTVNAYKQGTSADLTRLMNLSGAFGGSAHQNALANNEAALAKQLGNQTTSMYGQQYDRSANLEESNLARQMGAVPLAYQSQGLVFDRANQLMGYGNAYRNYEQQMKDAAYGSWSEGQNWNRNNTNWLASLIGGAQGSTGIQTQFGGYAPTNWGSTALGAGLLGSALFGGGR